MRAARAALAALAALLLAALLAAWLVPPRLDWAAQRGTLGALAGRMLGVPVRIDGPVHLVLLPTPGLTAGGVTIGNGTLAVGGLRLEAAFWPLLTGRVVPRDLVLHAPRLRLPWPVPLAPGMLPTAWPAGLAVRIEDGALAIGGAAVTGLRATSSAGDSGALTLSGQGMVGGQTWTFAARVSAAGHDGARAIDLRLDGAGPLASATIGFTGQLAGLATLNGAVTARGDDLSRLLPAPAVPFRAQGRLTAADGLVAADDLALDLAGRPAQAVVALRLLPVQRLDLSVAIDRLDLTAWIAPLLAPRAGQGALPVSFDLSAEAAALGAGTLRRLRASFDLTADGAALRDGAAILPGDAAVHLAGNLRRTGPDRFTGAGSLEAPDLPATFAWAAAALGVATGPLPLPHAAALHGDVAAAAGSLAIRHLAGTLDGAAFQGALDLASLPTPRLRLTARMAQLSLDPWLGVRPGAGATTLDLHADVASLRGVALRDLTIQGSTDAAGTVLRRGSVRLGDAALQAAGTRAPDGRITQARLDLQAATAEALAALLPPAAGDLMRRAAPLHLTVAADPVQGGLAVHGRLDAAGGTVTTDPYVDLRQPAAAGAVAVTHPDAAALLARLGWLPPGAQGWLGVGALDMRGQLDASADRLSLLGLEMTAGALRGKATLAAEWSSLLPRLTGRVAFATLPLPWPDWSAPSGAALPFRLLSGWEAALEVSADRVLVDQVPLTEATTARVGVAEGVLGIGGFAARLGGGTVAGSAAIDSAAAPPTVQAEARITDARLPDAAKMAEAGLGLRSGTVSGELRLSASGFSLPALRATLQGRAAIAAHDGAVAGIDLALARATLLRAGADETGATLAAALRPALAGGSTAFATLRAEGALSGGGVVVHDARLTGPDGEMTASGVIGIGAAGTDVRLGLRPAFDGAPEIGLHLTGAFADPLRTPELSAVLRWLSRS